MPLHEVSDKIDAEEEDAVLLIQEALKFSNGARAATLLAIASGICLREGNCLDYIETMQQILCNVAKRPTTKRYFP